MRKIISLLLILALALLSGCGERRVCALPEEKDAKLLSKRPIPVMSGGESLEMARHMSANRVWVTQTEVYTLDFDEEYQPVLARYRRENGSLGGFEILVRSCAPEHLSLYEGRLYYINTLHGRRVECFDPALGERRVLSEGPCGELMLRDGRMFYRRADGFYCSASPEGGGEQVIIGRSCRYVWPLGAYYIFQDESDGDRLHLFCPEDGTDITLSPGAAYAPLQIGDRLFYTTDEGVRSLCADGFDPAGFAVADMLGAAELVLTEGQWMLRVLREDKGFSQCLISPGGGAETMLPGEGYRWCDYIDGSCRVDAVYFADGRLRDLELSFPDGSALRYISGSCVPG